MAEPARGTIRVAFGLVVGSIAWGGLMAASGAFSLWRLAWQNGSAVAAIVVLLAMGGALSYAPAVVAADLVSRKRSVETRFAAYLLALAAATIAATAFLFALHYRIYYAAWHDPPLTVGWVFEFVFTSAAAAYHFSVLGIRLFLPLGFPGLFVVALWHATRSR